MMVHEERRSPADDAPDARGRLLAAMPVAERRLGLAGIPTTVLEGGAGPPIVLLHGPVGYAAQWLRVIPELATSHRVVAPDLPGHGASEVGDGPLDADRVSAWLSELIDRTCTSRPALVGHLLGGAIGARFAIDHGDRLSHLVLVDTFGLTPFQPALEFAVALTEFFARPSQHTHQGLWRFCAHDLDRLRQQMGERWEPFEAYNLDRAGTPTVMAAFHILMERLGMPEISPAYLEGIAVPTTLIWGRHDLATRLSIAQAASVRYGWPLHVIEDANNGPPIEQPEAFLSALRVALDTSAGEEAAP